MRFIGLLCIMLAAHLCIADAYSDFSESAQLVFSSGQELQNARLSYMERLEHYLRITGEEKLPTGEAPRQFYVFWSEGSRGAVSYRAPTPNEDGIVPIGAISSYSSSNNYDYGTDFSHTKYVYDEQEEKLYLRQTTQYYLQKAAQFAKASVISAQRALKTEGINEEKLQGELSSLYASIDREEADIAFAHQPHEISFAADMLKNDLAKAKEAVRKAHVLCAQKKAEELISEARKEEKAGDYLARAQSTLESIRLYPTAEKFQRLLYGIKMSFRWTK